MALFYQQMVGEIQTSILPIPLEEIGCRGISVIGLKFIGKQAKFVVENDYTKYVLDFNKSQAGIETEVVGENTITFYDAVKALAFIKLKMRKDNQKLK